MKKVLYIHHQGQWRSQFTNMVLACTKVEITPLDLTGLTKDECLYVLGSIGEGDYDEWYFMQATDWCLPFAVKKMGPNRVSAHEHGSLYSLAWSEFDVPFDVYEAQVASRDIRKTCNSPVFCGSNVTPIGFPLPEILYKQFPSQECLYNVVVPGRLVQDKGLIPILSALNTRAMFCTPEEAPSRAAVEMITKLGHLVFWGAPSVYRFILASSRVVLSASIVDTFNISLAEAIESGCTPVVPKTELTKLCCPEAIFYPPLCIQSMREAVEEGLRRPKAGVLGGWYAQCHPQDVTRRLEAFLEVPCQKA